MQQNEKPGAIILFDGVCNFCNATVQFVLKHDKNEYFYFAPLQSGTGKKLCAQNGIDPEKYSSVVLIENGKAYLRSEAALRITKKLNGGWPLLYAFKIIPATLRDAVYNLIAKNRYKWFGKKDACMVPEPNWKNRFLD